MARFTCFFTGTAGILLMATTVSGALSVFAAGPYETPGLEPFDDARFIEPAVCEGCHGDIYNMWNGSMHSKAFDDPLFRAATKLFVTDTADEGERADAEHCVACHNPIAYRSGRIPGSSADYSNVEGVTAHSISCDLCHSISEIVEVHNASFNTAPGHGEDDPGTKRGPRDDAEPMYHKAVYSAIHTSSEFCGVCHTVHHLSYLTRLEGTFDEWYHSPYNTADEDERIICQDCHMRQTPGDPSTGMTERPDYPGRAAMMGKDRPHIYRHSIVGANAYLPPVLGYPGNADMAVERLKHAAVLELASSNATGDGQWAFTIRVRNEGAGHMLPTGVSEYRQMWLSVTVIDAGGETVYSSGELADNGALPDDVRLFNTVFGDSDGNPTMNVARAAVLLTDRRVPPKGYIDERFILAEKPASPSKIIAELRYRSLDPAVAGLLLGEDAPPVPVVIMAELEEQVR